MSGRIRGGIRPSAQGRKQARAGSSPRGGRGCASSPSSGSRPIDFGYRLLRLRGTGFSARVPLRLAAICTALFAMAVVLALVSITQGDLHISLPQVLQALAGVGERGQVAVIRQWRLPVAIAAVVFGSMLGMGGAIFQSLTRNPLGSPDIIGFDAGSYTAVIVTVLVLGANSTWAVAMASLVGGALTALVVYLLAYRRGVQGFRLIIVGIGVAAMLGSIDSYLIVRASIRDAMIVGFWGAGSIARVTWESLTPALVVAGVITMAAALLAPALRRLELGDDAAITLGTPVGAARLGLVAAGVATTALVTAAAGPIGFVALVAPQLARRLARSPGVSLVSSAAMGAVLLTMAHLAALLISSVFRPVPVGLLTICLGGGYLIWLLVAETRRHYRGPG